MRKFGCSTGGQWRTWRHGSSRRCTHRATISVGLGVIAQCSVQFPVVLRCSTPRLSLVRWNGDGEQWVDGFKQTNKQTNKQTSKRQYRYAALQNLIASAAADSERKCEVKTEENRGKNLKKKKYLFFTNRTKQVKKKWRQNVFVCENWKSEQILKLLQQLSSAAGACRSSVSAKKLTRIKFLGGSLAPLEEMNTCLHESICDQSFFYSLASEDLQCSLIAHPDACIQQTSRDVG